jgi:hypothetical protein
MRAKGGLSTAYFCSGPISGHRNAFGSLVIPRLVSASNQRSWHAEAQRLCGLEIDRKLEFCRKLNWKIARLLSLENTADIVPGTR